MDLTTAESTATALPETAPLKVAVILASNREGRFAPVVANWFLAHTDAHPAIETDVLDIAELDLPASLKYRLEPGEREQVAGIGARLAEADAFVVVTPEYNHSYPAPLKNLIDWYRSEWQAKPVAFVSYGGVAGGLRAVEHLRQVFAEVHSVSIRDTVSFHNAGGQFDDEGRHRDPAGPDAAVKTLLDQLIWWGRALRDARRVRPYGG
ncbi:MULTISPECIES: NADPH-dependent FMN reductase [unclassified Streptomyces]|uniref:NADPH-dependent FMN reductase n=1 Tax=unclassified Streptomyces TaxID=2593676 RepID=UPI000DAF1C67|nr:MULTISPECIES: NAD(P)H-dependent oxidoreductase [unclassified Streptomyces]PZT74970.1 NADPH-dependent FMN reductase [Streptomyces sp. AC1-42T]PZT82046.1 NADPH-dependent FMN reductase [Streptomyces sp. AC1-42W]